MSTIANAIDNVATIELVPTASGYGSLMTVTRADGAYVRGTSADLNHFVSVLSNRRDVTLETWNGGRSVGTLEGITETGLYFNERDFQSFSVGIERVKKLTFN
jgi:hypothetical protein